MTWRGAHRGKVGIPVPRRTGCPNHRRGRRCFLLARKTPRTRSRCRWERCSSSRATGTWNKSLPPSSADDVSLGCRGSSSLAGRLLRAVGRLEKIVGQLGGACGLFPRELRPAEVPVRGGALVARAQQIELV